MLWGKRMSDLRAGIDYLSSGCIACNIAAAGGSSIHKLCSLHNLLHKAQNTLRTKHKYKTQNTKHKHKTHSLQLHIEHLITPHTVHWKKYTIHTGLAFHCEIICQQWNVFYSYWFILKYLNIWGWCVGIYIHGWSFFIVFIFCGSVSLEVFPLGRREGGRGSLLVLWEHISHQYLKSSKKLQNYISLFSWTKVYWTDSFLPVVLQEHISHHIF